MKPKHSLASIKWKKSLHLLTARQFNSEILSKLIDLSSHFDALPWKDEPLNLMRFKKLRTLFFEESTRTINAFEEAFIALGGTVLNEHARRPESPEDMARVMTPSIHCAVVRHEDASFIGRFAGVSQVPVINAGDGANEHPTQSLVDLYTIIKELGSKRRTIDGARIVIAGDLKYGRSAHSLVITLAAYAKVHFVLVSTDGLRMPSEYQRLARQYGSTIEESGNLAAALEGAAVVYMTRLQPMAIAEVGVRASHPKLTQKIFSRHADNDTIIMHPMPRSEKFGELSTDLEVLPNFAVFRQANNGIPVRMAVLAWLLLSEGVVDGLLQR